MLDKPYACIIFYKYGTATVAYLVSFSRNIPEQSIVENCDLSYTQSLTVTDERTDAQH